MYGVSSTTERNEAHHARMQQLFAKMDDQIGHWRHQFHGPSQLSEAGRLSSRPVGAPPSSSSSNGISGGGGGGGSGAHNYRAPFVQFRAHPTRNVDADGGSSTLGGYAFASRPSAKNNVNNSSSTAESTSIDNTFLEHGVGPFGTHGDKENENQQHRVSRNKAAMGRGGQQHADPAAAGNVHVDLDTIPTGNVVKDQLREQAALIIDLQRKNAVIATELLAAKEEAKAATEQLVTMKAEQKRLAKAFEAVSAAFTVTQQDNNETKRRVEAMERLFCSKIPNGFQLTPQAIFGKDTIENQMQQQQQQQQQTKPANAISETIDKFNAMNAQQTDNNTAAMLKIPTALSVQVNRNTASIDVINERLVLLDARLDSIERNAANDRASRQQLIEDNVQSAMDFAVIKLRKDIESASAIAAKLALSEERQYGSGGGGPRNQQQTPSNANMVSQFSGAVPSLATSDAINPKRAVSGAVQALQHHMEREAERELKGFSAAEFDLYNQMRAERGDYPFADMRPDAEMARGGANEKRSFSSSPSPTRAAVAKTSTSPYTRASPEQLRDNFDAYQTQLERLDRQRSQQSETERLRREEESLAFERDMAQQRQKLETELKAREEERRLIAERHEKEQREQDERRMRQAAEIQERFNAARRRHEETVAAEKARAERERQLLIDAHRKSLIGNLTYQDDRDTNGTGAPLSATAEGTTPNRAANQQQQHPQQSTNSYFGVESPSPSDAGATSTLTHSSYPQRRTYFDEPVAAAVIANNVSGSVVAGVMGERGERSAVLSNNRDSSSQPAAAAMQSSYTRSVLNDTVGALEAALGTSSSSNSSSANNSAPTSFAKRGPVDPLAAADASDALRFGPKSVTLSFNHSLRLGGGGDDQPSSYTAAASHTAQPHTASRVKDGGDSDDGDDSSSFATDDHNAGSGNADKRGFDSGTAVSRMLQNSSAGGFNVGNASTVNNTLPPLDVSALTSNNDQHQHNNTTILLNGSNASYAEAAANSLHRSGLGMATSTTAASASAIPQPAKMAASSVAPSAKKKESIITAEDQSDSDDDSDDGLQLLGMGAKGGDQKVPPPPPAAVQVHAAQGSMQAGGMDDSNTALSAPSMNRTAIVTANANAPNINNSSTTERKANEELKPEDASGVRSNKNDTTASSEVKFDNSRSGGAVNTTATSGSSLALNTTTTSSNNNQSAVGNQSNEVDSKRVDAAPQNNNATTKLVNRNFGSSSDESSNGDKDLRGLRAAMLQHHHNPQQQHRNPHAKMNAKEGGGASDDSRNSDHSNRLGRTTSTGGRQSAMSIPALKPSPASPSGNAIAGNNGLLDSRDVSPSPGANSNAAKRRAPPVRIGAMAASDDEDGNDNDEHHGGGGAAAEKRSSVSPRSATLGGGMLNLGGGVMMGGRRPASRQLGSTLGGGGGGGLGSTLASLNFDSTLNSNRGGTLNSRQTTRKVGNNLDSDDDDEDDLPPPQRLTSPQPKRSTSSNLKRKIGNNFNSDDSD